ncbi:MAG: nicotinamide riboside transporter PnuC [bacterium]|nr:nicotinamide riboside transporter PnuC [bacterium]
MAGLKNSFKELKWYEWLMAAIMIIIAARAMVLAFCGGEEGNNPAWLDASTVAIGIAATVLSMLRFREQYIWWLITDFVAVAMYIARFDPVYLTKKSIYLIMAVIGLINWIKLSRINKANE